jgi:hypothetical protein
LENAKVYDWNSRELRALIYSSILSHFMLTKDQPPINHNGAEEGGSFFVRDHQQLTVAASCIGSMNNQGGMWVHDERGEKHISAG